MDIFAVAPPGDFVHIHGTLTGIEENEPSVFQSASVAPNPNLVSPLTSLPDCALILK